MSTTLISGIVFFVLGVAVTIMSLSLPDASLGMPHAPKVFPTALGLLMIVFSFLQIFKESLRIRRKKSEKKETENNPFFRQILLTCLLSVVYALVFTRIGYVLATFFFLEGELWLFNGKKQWKVNTIVALAFSVGIYLLFAKALGVYLPMTPGIGF